MSSRRLINSKLFLGVPLLVLLVLGVACGGASEPAAPAGQDAPTVAVPVATAAPAAAVSGLQGAGEKVTVLIVDVQNKIMWSRLDDGPDLKFLRMIQDDLIAGGGGSVVKPGLIKEWNRGLEVLKCRVSSVHPCDALTRPDNGTHRLRNGLIDRVRRCIGGQPHQQPNDQKAQH